MSDEIQYTSRVLQNMVDNPSLHHPHFLQLASEYKRHRDLLYALAADNVRGFLEMKVQAVVQLREMLGEDRPVECPPCFGWGVIPSGPEDEVTCPTCDGEELLPAWKAEAAAERSGA